MIKSRMTIMKKLKTLKKSSNSISRVKKTALTVKTAVINSSAKFTSKQWVKSASRVKKTALTADDAMI